MRVLQEGREHVRVLEVRGREHVKVLEVGGENVRVLEVGVRGACEGVGGGRKASM